MNFHDCLAQCECSLTDCIGTDWVLCGVWPDWLDTCVTPMMLCCVQLPGMMMSPMMRGVNNAGYYPNPYEASHVTSVSPLTLLWTTDKRSGYEVLNPLNLVLTRELHGDDNLSPSPSIPVNLKSIPNRSRYTLSPSPSVPAQTSPLPHITTLSPSPFHPRTNCGHPHPTTVH